MTIRSAALVATIVAAAVACSADEPPAPAAAASAKPASQPAAPPQAAAPTTADSLPNGIMLALAQFVTEKDDDGNSSVVPGPARAEFLFRRDGSWQTTALEDPDSNVFHKIMVYDPGTGPRLLTLGGSEAIVRSWELVDGTLVPTDLWRKDFGGKWSRMRDAEVVDLDSDGKPALAVATHDQGVVAIVKPEGDGYTVSELDRRPDIFVHEIETGDLDADGVPEIYATPSEPNRLDGSPQSGEVVRYIPAQGGERVVVADLGDRHAKEILVADVDGDGIDELYVSVEGETEGKGANRRIKSPVEMRRYGAATPPTQGAVIATLQDSLSRFLTVGDIDGDGKREMVVATFSVGLWLFRPGADPSQPWKRELIDRDSAGFEHASILADLDEDGVDELYVASDKHKEVRRYVWNGAKLVRETIYTRPDDRPIFTWNLMPVPVSLIPGG
ncbi:MAG: VCBS repeat-containing protein [Myxococcota bacterium]